MPNGGRRRPVRQTAGDEHVQTNRRRPGLCRARNERVRIRGGATGRAGARGAGAGGGPRGAGGVRPAGRRREPAARQGGGPSGAAGGEVRRAALMKATAEGIVLQKSTRVPENPVDIPLWEVT